MEKEKVFCETCKFYCHTPNILGGTTYCLLAVKVLMTFWPNPACDLHVPKEEKES